MKGLHISTMGTSFMLGLSLSLMSAAASRQPVSHVSHKGLVLYFHKIAPPLRDVSGLKKSGESTAQVVSNSALLVSMQQTHQLTYSAWIKPNSIPTEFPVLLSKGGNQRPGAYGGYEFALNCHGDHDLLFLSGNYSATTGSGWINNHLGEWTQVAFTIDTQAQTAQFYVNGQPTGDTRIGSGSISGVNFNLTNNLYIGSPDPEANVNRASFDGEMREVMLFNRVLSAEEVQTLYSTTSPPIEKQPKNPEGEPNRSTPEAPRGKDWAMRDSGVVAKDSFSIASALNR